MNNVEKYIISLQDKFSATMTKIEASSKRLDSSMMNVRKSVLSLQGAMAGVGFGLFARNVVMTTAKMEGLRNAIDFASGGGQQGIYTLKMLENTSNKLGVSLEATMEGYKTFSASVMGTGLSIEQSQKVFNDVSVGISAMGLTAEKSKLIFMALGQMMSKGKVSSEELRLQLGESLPGALNIAARSVGKTTAEFNKMMEKGEVISKDFLPGFAAEIANTFGGLLPKSTQSLQANINRLSNSFLKLQESIGQNLYPQITKLIIILTKLMEKFGQLMEWISKNKNTIRALAVVIAVYATPAIIAFIVQLNLLSVAFGVLSTVMLLNPYVAFAAGVLVLVGVFRDLYKTNERIMNFFNGLSAALENLDKRFDNSALRVRNWMLSMMGKSDQIQKVQKVGETIGEAWARGVSNGVSGFKSNTYGNFFSQMGLAGMNAGGGGGDTTITDTPKTPKEPTSITGSAPKVFNINVDKLIDGFTITTNNLTESATAIKEHVTRALAEALSDIQTVAS
jgi:tape measure domain-containing protein